MNPSMQFSMVRFCRLLPSTAVTNALIISILQLSMAFAGEKPTVDRIFPPGGQAGSVVESKLNGKVGDGDLQVWSDHNQLQITFSEQKDVATITIPADAEHGLHWLRFYNASGATAPIPFVVGSLEEALEKEPNNRLNEVQALESSAIVVNGVLEKSGDVDCYSIPVKAGQTLVASMLANRYLGSPMDAVLQLLDSRGTVLWQNDDDHGLDPQINFLATVDDTLIVRTFAFPSAPNSSIQFAGGSNYVYRLILTTGPFIDHALPTAIKIGQLQDVRISGWNLPQELSVRTVDATIKTATDMSPVTIAGIYAEPLILPTISCMSLTEEAASAELMVPFAVSGLISAPNELDEFRFSGSKGQKLRVQAIARADYSMLDPLIIIRTADGKELKQADDVSKDNLDADVTISLPSDGVYTLQLKDRFDHGGPRFFYRVQVQEAMADFSLSVKEDSLVVPSDKPAEIIVAVTRTEGFGESIQIAVTDLPEGITCEAVTSEHSGDSAKSVTLKLTGQSTSGFTGPIRIHGTTATGFNKAAVASGIPAQGPVELIWLTVPATPASEEASVEDKSAE